MTAIGRWSFAAHPKAIVYTKNHNLGLEVPYRYGSMSWKYLPDFIFKAKVESEFNKMIATATAQAATGSK